MPSALRQAGITSVSNVPLFGEYFCNQSHIGQKNQLRKVRPSGESVEIDLTNWGTPD